MCECNTNGHVCGECKETAHKHRMSPCTLTDKRCPYCHSKELQTFEMDETFEHHCLLCDKVWLRWPDGERQVMGTGSELMTSPS